MFPGALFSLIIFFRPFFPRSFTEIAGKVHRGLRVFYKVFTEQAEVLYQHVLLLYAIADDLSNFHRRAKIANITGGTTTAVGGVAAIAGLALAPVTFGASLIVSAVGLGVATAGGITAASAAISDNVHDMNDRKKIELVVQDYETHLTELQSCLRFISEGIRRLRCHPLLRRNNYYAGDWEVRRALQTVSLVSEPVERAEDIVANAMAALNSVCKGMDKYFTKDSRELRKGCKKEVTMRVRMLAKQLHEGLVELNSIREQLLDASGNI
uniref:Si:cabz01007807.1 n=1 Tax=Astyanax mexicanus TaxID=7994 RepID=W5KP34_ASTMX